MGLAGVGRGIRVTISPSPDAGERLLWDVERPPVLVYDAAVELVAIPRKSIKLEAPVDDVAVESVTLTGVGESHAFPFIYRSSMVA